MRATQSQTAEQGCPRSHFRTLTSPAGELQRTMAASWFDVIGFIVVCTVFFGVIAAFVWVTESAKKELKSAACYLPVASRVLTISWLYLLLLAGLTGPLTN